MTDKLTTIQVRVVTRDRLMRHGEMSQTYDEVLTRLLDQLEGKL